MLAVLFEKPTLLSSTWTLLLCLVFSPLYVRAVSVIISSLGLGPSNSNNDIHRWSIPLRFYNRRYNAASVQGPATISDPSCSEPYTLASPPDLYILSLYRIWRRRRLWPSPYLHFPYHALPSHYTRHNSSYLSARDLRALHRDLARAEAELIHQPVYTTTRARAPSHPSLPTAVTTDQTPNTDDLLDAPSSFVCLVFVTHKPQPSATWHPATCLRGFRSCFHRHRDPCSFQPCFTTSQGRSLITRSKDHYVTYGSSCAMFNRSSCITCRSCSRSLRSWESSFQLL